MSLVAVTEFGTIRKFGNLGVLKCPGCGEWGRLDADQYHGRISVDHASMDCPGGYHETHDFASAVEAVGGYQVSWSEAP